MKVICLLALLVLSSSAASIEPTLPPVEEPGYWGDWSTVYSSSLARRLCHMWSTNKVSRLSGV